MIKAVENSKSRHELMCIHWRRWVMEQPGGVAWLREQANLLRHRYGDLGPHKLAFPASTDG